MENYEKIAKWIRDSKNIVIMTGAGVSTDSGIPDWRSNGGIYNGNNNETYVSKYYFERKPKEFWKKFKEIFQMKIIGKYEPNLAHSFFAELEKDGKNVWVLTQNIDGLHQKSGSSNVIELHGTLNTATCPKCKTKYNLDYIMKETVPRCERKNSKGNACNFILKSDVVLFGDMLKEFKKAEEVLDEADLFIVLGTSLAVHPVNTLPRYYRYVATDRDDEELKMVLINGESTVKDNEFPLIIKDNITDTIINIKQYL